MNEMCEELKKSNKEISEIDIDELIGKFSRRKGFITKKSLFAVSLVMLVLFGFSVHRFFDGISDGDIQITYAGAPITATSAKKDHIAIPVGVVKANPFLPYRTLSKDEERVSDLPAFELVAPPESLNENSDAARVMDTIVSGILYDKFSPSAILNIEGNDYLVKKGDVINNYKILDISQNSVSVKLGANTYKAGIGEILTEGNVNYNEVSNLSKKFGGEKR